MGFSDDIETAIHSPQGTFSFISYGIVIDADQGTVRVVLRIFFMTSLLLVSYLGSSICRLHPLLGLLRRRKVPIVAMTGWLPPSDMARVMWTTRSNPLGLMGVVMLLYGLLILAADLATTGLVVDTAVRTRCPLDTSGIFWVFPPTNVTATIAGTPQLTEPGVVAVSDAVAASRRNGCMSGILGVLDMTGNETFCAEAEDIVGTWRCADTGDFPTTFEPFSDIGEMVLSLIAEGSLFGDEAVYTGPLLNSTLAFYTGPLDSWIEYNKDLSYQIFAAPDVLANKTDVMAVKDLLFLSANQWPSTNGTFATAATFPWNVKAALQHPSNFYDPIRLATLNCSLDSPQALWTQNLMLAYPWMLTWLQQYVWYQYDPRGYLDVDFDTSTWLEADAATEIEQFLNLMTTTVGFLHSRIYINNLMEENTSPPAADLTRTRGCIASWTKIPWPVVALFAVANLLLIGALGYLARLHVLLRAARRKVGVGTLPPAPPVGVVDWMKYAANVEAQDVLVSSRALRNWYLSPDLARGRNTWPVSLAEKSGRTSEALEGKGESGGWAGILKNMLGKKVWTRKRPVDIDEPEVVSPSEKKWVEPAVEYKPL